MSHEELFSILRMHYQAEKIQKVFKYLSKSESQLGQDIFVLCELSSKENGFFVEFGAGDGKYLSNTFMLEQEFGWTGILAEPNRFLFEHLKKNRPNAISDNRAVWTHSGETLVFNEVHDSYFSTIDLFSHSDSHFETRTRGVKTRVETISLQELLDESNAPLNPDFLSIDTEGSEFEILSQFNFEKYPFRVIVCEHNYGSNRERIFKLLTSKGYLRKYEEYSKHDDWYVNVLAHG